MDSKCSGYVLDQVVMENISGDDIPADSQMPTLTDTKIASSERNIRDLEDEIQMLKANGVLNTEDREEEIKQIEVYKSHSKFMKTKIDLKQELSQKESELLALQTKLETLSNQNSDCKQHIEVRKESLTAKEQRAAILQAEVDALRLRLEEKESFLNRKTKQLQNLTEEKGTMAGEIRDMKDMLEVKERKTNVLQKKIENLQARDKDKQLTSLKDRVKSLQTDSSNTDTALATLEKALSEKERIIERFKEQRERDDWERLEEIESFGKENKDLKEKVNALQAELTEKESSLIDLKEHASSLAPAGLKRHSKLKSLEIAIEQKKEEGSKLEAQLKKAHNVEDNSRMNPEFADRMKQLDKEAPYYHDECGKAQAEVDRLLEILKEVENEKNDKDKKIVELERRMKDQNKKVANLKHNQQLEKKKNARLLEEVRRREDSMADNSQHLQIEELTNALEKTRQELDATKACLASTQQSLAEKEDHLANLRIERRKQLEEILEMKQEAPLAAISEKDANIALLELSTSKKKKTQEEVMALKQENDRLVHQLKQQTQNRMKLMAGDYDEDRHHHHHHHHHHRSPGRSQRSNHRPSPDQGGLSPVSKPLANPASTRHMSTRVCCYPPNTHIQTKLFWFITAQQDAVKEVTGCGFQEACDDFNNSLTYVVCTRISFGDISEYN
ncbi:LOW QUALITY PROTEIN: ERC protein 2-like [Dugong dugon]